MDGDIEGLLTFSINIGIEYSLFNQLYVINHVFTVMFESKSICVRKKVNKSENYILVQRGGYIRERLIFERSGVIL